MKLRADGRKEHPVVGLKKGQMAMPKDGAEKKGVKKAPRVDPKEASKGDVKSSSSSEFDDVFNMNYTVPSQRSHMTEGDESIKEKRPISIWPRPWTRLTVLRRR